MKREAARPPAREDAPEHLSPTVELDDRSSVGEDGDHLQPIVVGARTAARISGVSRSFWLKLDCTGRVPRAIRLGRRKLWDVRELAAWFAAGAPTRERWEAMKGDDR